MDFLGLTHLAYYEELGVSPESTDAEIKKAYFKLALKLHPDRNPDDPGAEEKYKRIAKIYAILSDPQKRNEYDKYGEVDENALDEVDEVGEDSNSPWTVEQLKQAVGSKLSQEQLDELAANMDFARHQSQLYTYSEEILSQELNRAKDLKVGAVEFYKKVIPSVPFDLLSPITTLSKLVITGCQLATLPSERLTSLTNLKIVDLQANNLVLFPRCFSLPTIQVMILDHNKITHVDDEDIEPMVNLRDIRIFGNKLVSFSAKVVHLKNLLRLDLECNPLPKLPFDATDFPQKVNLVVSTPVKPKKTRVKTPKSSDSKSKAKKKKAFTEEELDELFIVPDHDSDEEDEEMAPPPPKRPTRKSKSSKTR